MTDETKIDDVEVEAALDDAEETETEVEIPDEVTNPLADFVNSVENQDFVNAQNQFNHAISDRLQQTLDQARLAIAGKLYNAEQEVAPETES